MIVGTAGHIDHGKSALVAALTGHAMDRLAEERRRGITIDLNFAPLDLGNGVVAGVVDVPGHEDFVRTMVAGASGIDLALLVIAADEGIMPQTEEHLLVLEQLGVPAGIPVVTKRDLVDSEWLELVLLEVAERLRTSPVAFGEPIAVSARSGEGIAELRGRITGAAATLRARSGDDAFRLPIDRAFSVAGIGTVVTGTAWSGSVRVGDHIRILPGDLAARVRSIESHGHSVERSSPGARTALGLVGVERSAIHRGHVAVTDSLPWTASRALDVELELAPGAPPVGPRTRVRVHLGTAEVLARVRTAGTVAPGGRALARLVLEAPVVARGGDRFVLRSYSPVATIGGGRVLDPTPPVRSRWPSPALEAAAPADRLVALLEHRQGMERAAAPLVLGVTPAAATAAIEGDRRLVAVGERLALRSALDAVSDTVLAQVKAHHRGHPTERGISAETLRHSGAGPGWLIEAAVAALAEARRLIVADGVAALPGFAAKPAAEAADVARVVEAVALAGLMPPTVAELEASLGRRDVGTILRLAAADGRVEAVERDRYYTREALEQFVHTVRRVGAAGEVSPGALRDAIGASRKYLIPLLEWADRRGITIRTGDSRRLNPRTT